MALLARPARAKAALARALSSLLGAPGAPGDGGGRGAAPPGGAAPGAGPPRARASSSNARPPTWPHRGPPRRAFAASAAPARAEEGRLVSFPLAQTGEGISECELIAWHVKVRARRAACGWAGACG
jgi:hypothetical protein